MTRSRGGDRRRGLERGVSLLELDCRSRTSRSFLRRRAGRARAIRGDSSPLRRAPIEREHGLARRRVRRVHLRAIAVLSRLGHDSRLHGA
jgi:hypothetical protein